MPGEMVEAMMVNEFLNVSVVQTSLDAAAAWVDDNTLPWQNCVRMSLSEELRAKREIRYFLANLKGQDLSPDIILFPELAIPIGFERQLSRAAEQLESIIIAGLDYRVITTVPQASVSNEALVIVPRRLRGKQVSTRTNIRKVGKTYPAPAEELKLSRLRSGRVGFHSHPTVWLFDSEELGKFGVAICYDFLDLDRIVMYRNKVQTLFILAYNKDVTSFDHMAEALSRTLFCNVVVCNCGHFGGSLAVCPFREPYRRTIYRHSGLELANVQTIQLPLDSILNCQRGNRDASFKSLPPGFVGKHSLSCRSTSI